MSGRGRHPGAFRRERWVGVKFRIEPVERRAIRADDFVVPAHVAEDMRMIEWRFCADAHESLRTDLDNRDAWIVMEMRNDVLDHDCSLEGIPSSPYRREGEVHRHLGRETLTSNCAAIRPRYARDPIIALVGNRTGLS